MYMCLYILMKNEIVEKEKQLVTMQQCDQQKILDLEGALAKAASECIQVS